MHTISHAPNNHSQSSIHQLCEATFNTPIIVVHYRYNGQSGILYAKQENIGISGLVNDRIALHLLKESKAIALTRYQPSRFRGDELMKNSLEALLHRLTADNEIDSLERFMLNNYFDHYSDSEWQQIMKKVHVATTFEEAHGQLVFQGIKVDAFVNSRQNDGLFDAAQEYFSPESPNFKLGYVMHESVSPYVDIHSDLYQVVGSCEIINIMACFHSQLGLNIGPLSASNILGAIKLRSSQLIDSVVLTALVDVSDDFWVNQLVGDTCDRFQMPSLILDGYELISAIRD